MDRTLTVTGLDFYGVQIAISYVLYGTWIQHSSITGMVPCECNTFLYRERPTFNPKTSGQFYGNCKKNKVNGIRGCYVNPGSSCHDAKPSVIGAPYRWSVEACKFREEQKLNG